MKIKGILTSCYLGKEETIDVETEIITTEDGRGIFQIIEGGVTGYESFYMDKVGHPKELSAFETNLDEMKRRGWLACAGTKGSWDRLFIPPEEMEKALP